MSKNLTVKASKPRNHVALAMINKNGGRHKHQGDKRASNKLRRELHRELS